MSTKEKCDKHTERDKVVNADIEFDGKYQYDIDMCEECANFLFDVEFDWDKIKDYYGLDLALNPIERVSNNMIRAECYGYTVGTQETIQFENSEFVVVVVDKENNTAIVEVLEKINDGDNQGGKV